MKLGEPVSSIKKPLHTNFQLLNCYSFSTATNLILASGAHFRPRAMTEIPISSDVINVQSCKKDFLEALERLFHLAYNNLTFDLIKVQRLCNLTFDLWFWKKGSFDFFQTFFTKTLNLNVFIHQVLIWDYNGNSSYRPKCSIMYTFLYSCYYIHVLVNSCMLFPLLSQIKTW